MKRTFLRCALGTLALCAAAQIAAQQADWKPNGPVELVVAAGAGGGNDRTARMLAKLLSDEKLVDVPLVVINKPGAGGVVAQNYLNSHRGSGNYLMITNPALITNPLTGIGNAKYTEVTPVAQLFTEYVVTVVKTGSTLKSGKELLAQLKKDPGSLSIALSPGLGAGPHIAVALVAQGAGIDATKLRGIPYSTAGEAMTAVLGGHVDTMATTPLNMLAQLKAGQIRALGVTAPKRIPGGLADVPTWKEQGDDVVFGNWRGVVGPEGMTRAQLAYWDGVFNKLIHTKGWQDELEMENAVDDYHNAADSKKFLDEENARLGQILKQLGLEKTN
jgi:putative tricarboxylic transport membrane protein